MKQRLRVWLRDELTKVVRGEISQTSATLEHKIDAGIAELHEDIAKTQSAATAIEATRNHDTQELAQALTMLANAITALHSRLDADVNERQLHLSSVEWLMRELMISFPPPALHEPSTLLGGTIEREPQTQFRDSDIVSLTASDEIDLREAERAVGMLVEVRSRFHDRWIRGFEIREIIDVGDIRRFRLTRISDHMALPVLFDSIDIRPLPVQPDFGAASDSAIKGVGNKAGAATDKTA